jgi:hypothetical protein
MSMLDWLKFVKEIKEEYYKETKKALEVAREKRNFPVLKEIRTVLVADVTRVWKEIDNELAPSIRKYSED